LEKETFLSIVTRAFLKTVSQVPHSHFERFRDPNEAVNRDVFFATLDVPDVNRVQIRQLSQLFLAHFGFLSVEPDVLA
jgi:hypothetical protein